MKSFVLVITLITVAAGAARATEMVEVPNAPPFMPPRPAPRDPKIDEANALRISGLASLGLGTVLEATALVIFVENPCTHDCFLDPVQPEARATIASLVAFGVGGVAAGLPLAITGGARLSRLRKNQLTLHAGVNGVSLSGRF